MLDGKFAVFIAYVRANPAFAAQLAEILKGPDPRSHVLVLLATHRMALSDAAVSIILGEGGPDSSEWNIGLACPDHRRPDASVIEGKLREYWPPR